MYKTKINKIANLIDSIKNDINLFIISDFLEWFYEKLDINFNKKNYWLDLQKWDIFYINLWKNIGSELNKNRPCIVYSKKFANKWNTVLVLPLKSFKWNKINKDISLLIYSDKSNNLFKNSIVDILWLRQVDKKRINWYIWKLDNEILSKIDKKISKIIWIKNKE